MRDATFWNDLISKSMTIFANLVFAFLWAGIVFVLVMNRELPDEIWGWVQAMPMVPKLIVWVVFLPIMVALWIWESSWPTVGRFLGFAGIAAWTCLAVSSIFKFFR